jgi:hypothetical protein
MTVLTEVLGAMVDIAIGGVAMGGVGLAAQSHMIISWTGRQEQ